MDNLFIEEHCLYAIMVKYWKRKCNTKLTITDKRIIFAKKNGIIKKKYKIIDTININDIKIYEGKVQIKCKNLTMVIETKDNLYQFVCGNLSEVRKIEELIITLRDNSTLVEKASNKVTKFSKNISKTTSAIVSGVASVGIAVATISKCKKEIVNVFKMMKSIIMKK